MGLALGCSDASEPSAAEIDFELARRSLPTLGDLQEEVLVNTCSPNPGVCHSGREYPALHTLGDLTALVGASCNVAPPVPELGWDACEGPPHWLELHGELFPIAATQARGPADWLLWFPEPLPATGFEGPQTRGVADRFAIVDQAGDRVFAPADGWETTITSADDGLSIALQIASTDGTELDDVVDSVMRGVRGGDPNRNGIWGGSASEAEQGRLVVPGSRRRSYLWRRVLGDVPGDPMPIANGPITNAQVLALGCWIEGLEPGASLDPADAIDYEHCSFATDPPLLVDEDQGFETDEPESSSEG